MRAPMLMKVAVVIALLVVPSLVMADTFIRQVSHQDGVMNMPANDDTTVTWMGDGVARTDGAGQSVIISAEKGMMYLLNHDDKTYAEIPLSALGDLEKMLGIDKMDPDQAEAVRQQLASMKSMMHISMTVTPTEETAKIKDWNCKKYIMDMNLGMAKVKSEAWVTNDIDLDWNTFWQTTNAMMLQMPGSDSVLAEVQKMKGLPVKTSGSANIMGNEVKTTSEVLEVSTKDAPAGTYQLPDGYTKKDFEFGAGMR